jgi:hypothetical protein
MDRRRTSQSARHQVCEGCRRLRHRDTARALRDKLRRSRCAAFPRALHTRYAPQPAYAVGYLASQINPRILMTTPPGEPGRAEEETVK